MNIASTLNVGLALAGWFFIIIKTAEFFICLALRQRERLRQKTRRQKAVEELYEAYELDKIIPGTAAMIPVDGELEVTIVVQRKNTATDVNV